MIEIHSHILPRMDDGIASIKESVSLARRYRKCGFSAVIATPHVKEGSYTPSPALITDRVERLNVELALAGVQLDVYTGAEYFLDMGVVRACEMNEIVTLGKSGFVLVEFPGYHLPKYASTIVSLMMEAGYVPVIAHPERYRYVQKSGKDVLAPFTAAGCKIQVDVPSLLGANGRAAEKAAWTLLREGTAELLGFDAHEDFPLEASLARLDRMLAEAHCGNARRFFDIDASFIQPLRPSVRG